MVTPLNVSVHEEYIIGPEDTPFFTKEWSPSNVDPKAYILFVHGFAEHINRYDAFFSRLAAASSLHITAFDQRGHGRTSYDPLTAESEPVVKWKAEGKAVRLEKNAKRRTGGWARVMPDIAWFVRRESERAKGKGKRLFLWGFSMGGGEVLAFATRPKAPPSPETVSLLSGIIAGGPLIRQTKSAPAWQLKSGTFAASLGLGNFLIPTPLNYSDLSHNAESNERCKADPYCEQVGSLRGVSDMLLGGASLDGPAAWDAWPQGLPLLVYHGEEDPICDAKTAGRFVDNVKARDKRFELIKGMYHEVHNELEPVPTDLIKVIGDWVSARSGEATSNAPTAGPGQVAGEGPSAIGQSKL